MVLEALDDKLKAAHNSFQLMIYVAMAACHWLSLEFNKIWQFNDKKKIVQTTITHCQSLQKLSYAYAGEEEQSEQQLSIAVSVD